MKYTAATLLSLAAVALAKPQFTNPDFNVVEGKPITLQFSGCNSGCSIVLQSGPKNHQDDFKTLIQSTKGDSFTWTPNNLPTNTYSFKIVDNSSGQENWSVPFDLKGTAETASTAVTSTPEPTSTVASTPDETSTTPSSTPVSTSASTSTSMTTPTSSASTSASVSPSASTSGSATTSDEATTATESGPAQSSGIPDADGAAGALSSPMALVGAAIAGLLFLI